MAAKVDHEAIGLAVLKQMLVQAFGQRNLSGFAVRCFRVGDEQDFLGKVDVFPPLAGDFAAAHPGIERHGDHRVEVILRGTKKQLFLGYAQHLSSCSPLPRHLHPSEWIGSQELLVDSPVENVAEDAQVPVDGRILDGRIVLLARFPKFVGEGLVDPQHREFRKERQQELEVI